MSRKRSFLSGRNRSRQIDKRWLFLTLALVVGIPSALWALHAVQSPRLARFLREEAHEKFAAGDWKEGVRYLRLYVGNRPDDIEAANELGLRLVESSNVNDLLDAQRLLRNAQRRGSMSTPMTTALLKLNLKSGDRSGAFRIARELESAAPPDLTAEAWRLMAEAYDVNDQRPDALRAAKTAIDAEPANLVVAAYGLPLIYRITGKADDLMQSIRLIIDKSNGDAMAHLLAYSVLRNADLPGAADHLKSAIAHSPTNIEVLLMAGRDAMNENPASAADYLQRAWEIAPTDPRIQLVYGRWLQWAGRPTEAREVYTAGFQSAGTYQNEFAWRLAEILIEARDESNTLADALRTVLEAKDYQTYYRFLRGRGDMLKGKLESAENHLIIGQRLLEQSTQLFANRGDREELAFKFEMALAGVAYAKGDVKRALRLAEAAHARLPGEFTPLITIGELSFSVGDLESSIEAWRKAIAQPFHPPGALLGLARSLLALSEEKPASVRNLCEVFDLIESAKRKIPNDVNLAMLESEALWLAGRADESLDNLRAADQLYDRNPEVALSLVRMLVADDRLEEAAKRLTNFEQRFGRQPTSVLTHVSLLARKGEYRSATEALSQAEKLFPKEARSTLLRLTGQLQSLAGDPRAESSLRDAALADTNDDLAWMTYWNWVNTHQGESAADKLAAAARKERGEADIRWRWADAVRTLERHRSFPILAAATLAEHATVLNESYREHWATWHIKGLEAEVNGRFDEALDHYFHSIARGPAYPAVTMRAVRILLVSKRFPDALAEIQLARRQRLPILEDSMLLAELDLARGHRESALGRVQAIAEATKTRVDTAVWLGTILQSLGQIPDAKEVREKLLTRYPDDIGVRLFDINLARSPSGQFDIDAALASIDQLPASPQRDFLRGQLRLAFGQIEAADESFRQAIDARSLDESSWRSVIDFLRWRNSDRLEAVVERAKAAFPEADWILDLTRS